MSRTHRFTANAGLARDQVTQVRSAPAQTLASCHATARRMLDDMKRGVIYARIPASVRLAASAGLCCAFRCTASSARWLVAGHHVSDAFHVEPFSRVPTRGMLPNSSGSMTGVLCHVCLGCPVGVPKVHLPFHRGRVIRRMPSTMSAAVPGSAAP